MIHSSGNIRFLTDSAGALVARYAYDPATGTFLARDPVLGPLDIPIEHGEYLYARNNPVNLSDPSGEVTYKQNRWISSEISTSNRNPLSHTLIFTTNPNGTLEHAYSWGTNSIWWGKWDVDHPNDITAANAALRRPDIKLKRVGPDELDPYVYSVYSDWENDWMHVHPNAGMTANCKQEADLLLIEAKRRLREDQAIMMTRAR